MSALEGMDQCTSDEKWDSGQMTMPDVFMKVSEQQKIEV